MCCNERSRYRRSLNRHRLRRQGFSLVELLAVIVILGLLAGVVTVSVRGYLLAGKQGVATTEIAEICKAINSFELMYDRFPTNEEGVEALAQPSERFPEPLLPRVPRDPWGNAYQYNHPGQVNAYDVISYGKDGREGGEGADRDISSAELGDE